jgi:hypothetical protein
VGDGLVFGYDGDVWAPVVVGVDDVEGVSLFNYGKLTSTFEHSV